MSRMKEFITGVRYLLQGFTFFSSHPKLWTWAIIPTLINLTILIGMIAGLIHYYDDIYVWISSYIGHIGIENPDVWYMHVLSWLLWVVDAIFQLFVILLSLVILLIVSYVAGLIIAAPFNDVLSEKVELIVTGAEPPPFSWKKFASDIIRTIRIESVKGVVLLLIPIILFVLNIIPLIGGPLYIALTFVFGTWDLGFAYADLPMGRRVAPLRDRVDFAMKRKWALMGLGLGFAIPFFSLLFSAPMVVGGTLLYVKHAK